MFGPVSVLGVEESTPLMLPPFVGQQSWYHWELSNNPSELYVEPRENLTSTIDTHVLITAIHEGIRTFHVIGNTWVHWPSDSVNHTVVCASMIDEEAVVDEVMYNLTAFTFEYDVALGPPGIVQSVTGSQYFTMAYLVPSFLQPHERWFCTDFPGYRSLYYIEFTDMEVGEFVALWHLGTAEVVGFVMHETVVGARPAIKLSRNFTWLFFNPTRVSEQSVTYYYDQQTGCLLEMQHLIQLTENETTEYWSMRGELTGTNMYGLRHNQILFLIGFAVFVLVSLFLLVMVYRRVFRSELVKR